MPDSSIESLPQTYGRPGFLLRRAHQICVAIFETHFAELELSPAQYSVLIALNTFNDLNQSDIGRAVGMSKVTVSQVVRGLEQRGWIVREAGTTDRRRHHLTLTAAGRKALARTREMADATYKAQMSPFSVAERKQLCSLLQRMVDTLEPCARTPFERIGAGRKG